MKIILVVIASAATVFSVWAQEPPYYYFSHNEIALKTVYDDSGKVIGQQEYSVLSGNGSKVEGQNIITKPGKKSETTSCHYLCEDGQLLIAMGINKYGEEVLLDYFTDMVPGSAVIESIEFETHAKVAGTKWKVTCTVTNRAVTAVDQVISSSFGEWNCIKTEYDMEIRTKFLGIPVNVHVIEWFSPGVGVVRTDVFRRGKLYETRLLTGFRTADTDGTEI